MVDVNERKGDSDDDSDHQSSDEQLSRQCVELKKKLEFERSRGRSLEKEIIRLKENLQKAVDEKEILMNRQEVKINDLAAQFQHETENFIQSHRQDDDCVYFHWFW
jgi:hypothetical protein